MLNALKTSLTAPQTRPARAATTAEVVILALLLFCLPLFEAPKHIFSALLILVFVIRGVMRRDFGRAPPFEWAIWVLLAVSFLGPLTSEYRGQVEVLDSAKHWLLIGLSAIVAARLGYGAGQWRVLVAAAILGGIAAVGESFWMWSLNGKTYPEFRSVGHVNHSALYMLAVLAAGFAALRDTSRWMQLLGVLGIVASFTYFVPSRSIVSLGAGLVVSALGLALLLRQRFSRVAILGAVGAVAVAFAGLMSIPQAAPFREEVTARFDGTNLLSHRDSILFMALEVYDRNPWFGTGVRSFNVATDPEIVRAELEAEGRDFDAEAGRFYFSPGHGHNLWTTLLIERGIVGVLAVTAYLALGLWAFARLHGQTAEDPARQAAARLGLLTMLYLAVAGLGNTTMIVEHGMAAMLLVAIGWGGATRPSAMGGAR